MEISASTATPSRSTPITTTSGNTFGCLVRFALANVRRRPERFVLSVLGIALALLCVTVVRTVTAWLQAAAMVLAFLPAMAIVGALVPVHRLLRQRPVDPLGDR